MKLYYRNKLIAFGDDSKVCDENGELVYKIDGKMLSPTKKKKIYDKDKNLQFVVRNKFWQGGWTKYALMYDAEKNLIATLSSKDYGREEFKIQGYKDELIVSRKAFTLEFKVLKGEEVVATVTRDLVAFKDAFVIDGPEEEMPFLVALVATMEGLIDKKKQDAKL